MTKKQKIKLFAKKELLKFNYINFNEKYHFYTDTEKNRNFEKSTTQFYKDFTKPFDMKKWSRIKCSEYGMTPEELKKHWQELGKESAEKGTKFHNFVEESYKIKKVAEYENEKLKEYFTRFLKDTSKRLLNIANEFNIGDRQIDIAGRVDGLFYDLFTDDYVLVDWKTNKKIEFRNNYNMLEFFQWFDTSEFIKFSLQLSMYKFIIERNVNIKIGRLEICWFNEKNYSYVVINLMDFTKTIKNYFITKGKKI